MPPGRAAHLAEAAAILLELSAEIEALGGALCADSDLAARHMEKLQAIDLIAQKQQHLSELLLADCPRTAIDGFRLDTLRERLAGHAPGAQ